MSDFWLDSYLMCANSKDAGETAQMRRLAWAFAGRLYDKYHNLMSWLKWMKQKNWEGTFKKSKCIILTILKWEESYGTLFSPHYANEKVIKNL